jgi:hypothetical protein
MMSEKVTQRNWITELNKKGVELDFSQPGRLLSTVESSCHRTERLGSNHRQENLREYPVGDGI